MLPMQASQDFVLGEEITFDTFEETYRWQNRSQGDISIGVENGVYRMRANVNNYVRGYSAYSGADVVIDVETLPFSNHDNNAYGVICRASYDDASANGYYFLIGADGSYSIRRGRQGDLDGLVDWTTHGAIRKGSQINTIRAVCIGDYLALYVNGEFIAEAYDTAYHDGRVGFAAATETGTTIDVTFDNLVIHTGVFLE